MEPNGWEEKWEGKSKKSWLLTASQTEENKVKSNVLEYIYKISFYIVNVFFFEKKENMAFDCLSQCGKQRKK